MRHLIEAHLSNSLVLSRIAVVALVVAGVVFGSRVNSAVPDVGVPLIYGLARWDSGYYIGIAKNGYGSFSDFKAFAFRPLYPLILRILYPLFGSFDVTSAMLLAGFTWNILAVIFTALFLGKLTRLLLGNAATSRTLLLLAIFPATVFLTAIYPEATALLLVVLSLYCLETNRPLLGGLMGFLAGMARPEALLVSVPFIIKWLTSLRNVQLLIAGVIASLSLPAFALFGYVQTGNFFIEFQVQKAWPSCTIFCILSNPVFRFADPQSTLPLTINFAVMIIAALFTANALMKSKESPRLFPYYFWSMIGIAIFFYLAPTNAWARLLLQLPGVLWSQAGLSQTHPRFQLGLVLTYTIMMSLSTILFVNWYPMI